MKFNRSESFNILTGIKMDFEDLPLLPFTFANFLVKASFNQTQDWITHTPPLHKMRWKMRKSKISWCALRAAVDRVPQSNAWPRYWHQIDWAFINRKIFWILFFHVIIKYTITIMSHIPIWFYVFCFFLLSFLQSVQREGRIQYLTGYSLQNNNLYYVLVKICTFFKH